MLSGRYLCDELITRPEESYRLWCVVVYDLENLKNEEAMTRVGLQRHRKKNIIYNGKVTLSFFHSIVVCWGSEATDPLILNLDGGGVPSFSHSPALPPTKDTLSLLNRRVCGPLVRFGQKFLGCPNFSLITY